MGNQRLVVYLVIRPRGSLEHKTEGSVPWQLTAYVFQEKLKTIVGTLCLITPWLLSTDFQTANRSKENIAVREENNAF